LDRAERGRAVAVAVVAVAVGAVGSVAERESEMRKERRGQKSMAVVDFP